jgi:hypothetical protein
MSALRTWIIPVAIVALPVCSFGQDQSRVDGRLDGRVESRIPRGYGNHPSTPEPERPIFTPCFRALRMPNGALVVLNCQPYPP